MDGNEKASLAKIPGTLRESDHGFINDGILSNSGPQNDMACLGDLRALARGRFSVQSE